MLKSLRNFLTDEVLDYIRSAPGVSRLDVIEHTNMSLKDVTQILKLLTEEKVIVRQYRHGYIRYFPDDYSISDYQPVTYQQIIEDPELNELYDYLCRKRK